MLCHRTYRRFKNLSPSCRHLSFGLSYLQRRFFQCDLLKGLEKCLKFSEKSMFLCAFEGSIPVNLCLLSEEIFLNTWQLLVGNFCLFQQPLKRLKIAPFMMEKKKKKRYKSHRLLYLCLYLHAILNIICKNI